jgi:hypothetical protein
MTSNINGINGALTAIQNNGKAANRLPPDLTQVIE